MRRARHGASAVGPREHRRVGDGRDGPVAVGGNGPQNHTVTCAPHGGRIRRRSIRLGDGSGEEGRPSGPGDDARAALGADAKERLQIADLAGAGHPSLVEAAELLG